ncbi:aldo/keto reductase [Herbiconiux sp. P16]|uniref:aldo/keto reductase n=1 Tax=Herbiconiux wuyangfengii TaxID=3342794 RepID=UPI003CFB892B
MSPLALGTAPLGDLYGGVDDETAVAVVDAAWDAGVRMFDTAPHYGLGEAERRLGEALRRRPRSAFRLSTKVGRLLVPDGKGGHRRELDFSERGIRASVEQSLTRLGVQRVHTLLIHDPEERMPQALAEAVPALERMKAEGLVDRIGVGSGRLSALEPFALHTGVDVLMVAGRLTLLDQAAARSLVPLCARRGIGILNAGVFNSGVLADASPGPASHFEYRPASEPVVGRARALAAVCAAHGVSLRTAAVLFGFRYPPVSTVVVGAVAPAQIAEAAASVAEAARLDLDALWAALERAALIDSLP